MISVSQGFNCDKNCVGHLRHEIFITLTVKMTKPNSKPKPKFCLYCSESKRVTRWPGTHRLCVEFSPYSLSRVQVVEHTIQQHNYMSGAVWVRVVYMLRVMCYGKFCVWEEYYDVLYVWGVIMCCVYAKGIIDLVSVPYPVPRSLGSLALFAHGKNGSGS